MKKTIMLTGIELKIMKVLWDSGKPLTITGIARQLEKEGVSAASVGQAMRRLDKKGTVEVKDFVASANAYARTFVPVLGRDEYLSMEISRLQKGIFGREQADVGAIVTKFLGVGGKTKVEQIKECRAIIDESLKKLEGEK